MGWLHGLGGNGKGWETHNFLVALGQLLLSLGVLFLLSWQRALAPNGVVDHPRPGSAIEEQMPINISLEEDQVQEQRRRVMLNVWVREFFTGRLGIHTVSSSFVG